MIGFFNETPRDTGHSSEDPDTQNLDKKHLYDMIAHRYYLPPYQSRGVTREYLLGVHKVTNFRVTNSDLRHFEVDLSPAMTKKVGVQNNGLLVRKLNNLLLTRNLPVLGFEEFEPPEQVVFVHKAWLFRVARYIDRTNLTDFFEAPAENEPPVNKSSSNISRVYHGRIKASTYFFRIKAAKNNRKLWDQLHNISDAYRAYLSHKLSVEVLRRELDQAEQRTVEVGNTLEDLISKAAFSYTTLENPKIRPEMIINGTDGVTQEMRDAVSQNCRL
jgi:hypothetical protein